MIRGNVTVEENTCKHWYNGLCLLYDELCPANISYNEENENNVPCDLASYKHVVNDTECGVAQR